jgi:hypothetical protein
MQRHGLWPFAAVARVACGFVVTGLMLGVPTQAGVLYNNLGNASGFGAIVDSIPSNQGFSTGSNSYSLSSVTVGLYYDGSAGTVTAYLYSDFAGAPGSSLANLGTILDSSITCCAVEDDITFTSPPGVFLAANTTYFVLLQGSTPSPTHDTLWAVANDNTGPGVAGQPGSLGPTQSLVMEVQASSWAFRSPASGCCWQPDLAHLPRWPDGEKRQRLGLDGRTSVPRTYARKGGGSARPLTPPSLRCTIASSCSYGRIVADIDE